MTETLYTVSLIFFKDNNCKNVINTTIIGIYNYNCEDCYSCKYIAEDQNISLNTCFENKIWNCKPESFREESDIQLICAWLSFTLCCCCLYCCCFH